MSRYMLINLGAWSVPLLFTFGPFAPYYKKLGRVLAAYLTAGAAFIAWDVWATAEGHWGFAPEHVMGVRLAGLPVEEVLFFLIIPYSSLFILANLQHYFADRTFSFPVSLAAVLSAGFIAAFAGLMYTVRVRAVIPDTGITAPLEVITAVMIGGTAMSGGKGSIVGGLLGVLAMFLLLNGFSLLGLNPFWQVIIEKVLGKQAGFFR